MSPKIKKRGLSNIVLTKSRDLLKRRFPQILGVYLACSWGILEKLTCYTLLNFMPEKFRYFVRYFPSSS